MFARPLKRFPMHAFLRKAEECFGRMLSEDLPPMIISKYLLELLHILERQLIWLILINEKNIFIKMPVNILNNFKPG